MNERKKLNESRFFLEKMKEVINDFIPLTYYLSAFLAAARSVLQYALKEAQTHNGQLWYKGKISSSSVLRFFKDKRDVNIHSKPIHPTRETTIHETISIAESLTIQVIDKEGKIIQENTYEEKSPTNLKKKADTWEERIIFNDWQGNEDLFELCDKYLKELEEFVSEGIQNKFLTG